MNHDEPWSGRGAAPTRPELGADLAAVSIDELRQRIGWLLEEIGRIEAEIARKEASREAASGIFKL